MDRRFLTSGLVAIVLATGVASAAAYAIRPDPDPIATTDFPVPIALQVSPGPTGTATTAVPLTLTREFVVHDTKVWDVVDVTPTPSTTVDVGTIASDAEPTILAVLSLIIGAIVGLIAWEAKRLLGVTVNAKYTTLLHDALLRAATSGVDTAVRKAQGVQVDVHSTAIANGITYMRTYRADLLKRFGLDDAKLTGLLRTYVNKALPADAQIPA